MKERLNFAPKPFRARSGTIYLLWAGNVLLLLGLLVSIWHWSQLHGANRAVHDRLDSVRQEQRDLVEAHDRAVRALEQIDMKTYRKQLDLFQGIQTAFATNWGRLLDDLGAVMNEDVRLLTLRPGRTRARETQSDTTLLYLSGEARTKEAQLELIRTLQASPLFDDVRIAEERYRGNGGIALAFEISFRYQGGS